MSQSFALVATGALISAFQIMRSKNPVHSVFYLVLQYLHCSGLLVIQGLEYFVLLQLQVYVGALAILFLFVVILLDITSTEILAHQRGTYPVAGILAFCLIIAAIQALWQPTEDSSFETIPFIWADQQNNSLPWEAQAFDTENNIKNTQNSNNSDYNFWQHYNTATSSVANQGIAQYGVHADQLIIASLLQLVAMVGAVALTQKRPVAAPHFDVFAQHYVDFQKVVVQIPVSKK